MPLPHSIARLKPADERARLLAMIEDFRAAEEPLLDKLDEQIYGLLRGAIPRLQAYVLETGKPEGTMTITLGFRFNSATKEVSVNGEALIVPPPTSLKFAEVVSYAPVQLEE